MTETTTPAGAVDVAGLGAMVDQLKDELVAQADTIRRCQGTMDKVFREWKAAESRATALAHEVERMREALGPFAKIAPHVEHTSLRDGEVVHRQAMHIDGKHLGAGYMELRKEDFRRARAALSPQPEER